MIDSLSAKQIASELLKELREGKRDKIGIDEIREAIKSKVSNHTEEDEALVCRKVVEGTMA
jgi:2-phosphoglycerate kinase